MKHAAHKRQRAPPPAAAYEEGSLEDEPEQAPLQAKRSRRVPQPAHYEDSEGDSGDSQSDTSGSGSEPDGDSGEEEEEGLPMGQLVALRQDGSTSAAAMKARAKALREQGGPTKFKREGKHRPVEMSSKKPVPVLRDTMQGGKRVVRDPRFESLSAGQYDEERFKKRYAFLYDDKMPAERDELRASLARTKGAAARAELEARLDRVEQQLRSEAARRKREGFQKKVKANEREAVRTGKRPFFLKKSEQRRLELVAKYEELKAAGPGKLDKFLEKRRKRNAAKDHRYLPSSRRGGGEQQGE